MSSQAFYIDKTLLNSVFLNIIQAAKYRLKPFNNCIRTFQISPKLTKKAQEWINFDQY